MFKAFLVFFGFILILGGVGYIDDMDFSLANTLVGAGISLIGIVMWISALLLESYDQDRNNI